MSDLHPNVILRTAISVRNTTHINSPPRINWQVLLTPITSTDVISEQANKKSKHWRCLTHYTIGGAEMGASAYPLKARRTKRGYVKDLISGENNERRNDSVKKRPVWTATRYLLYVSITGISHHSSGSFQQRSQSNSKSIKDRKQKYHSDLIWRNCNTTFFSMCFLDLKPGIHIKVLWIHSLLHINTLRTAGADLRF